MPLSDVKGQDRACESLLRALNGKRLHHAYLFAGPEGVGKTLAARQVAQAMRFVPIRGRMAMGVESAMFAFAFKRASTPTCTLSSARRHRMADLIARLRSINRARCNRR